MKRKRCRHCDEPPVISMRQHKLALCEAHFVAWVHEQTLRSISDNHVFVVCRDGRFYEDLPDECASVGPGRGCSEGS